MTYTGNQFYTYIYYDHRHGHTPIYVGKGKGDRVFSHFKNSRNTRLSNTLRKIETDGHRVFFGLINCPDEEFSFLLEMELISKFGRRDLKTGTLFNLTDGGEGESGRVYSEEIRLNMSKAQIGRKMTPECVAKRVASQTGLKRSNETKKKMSLAQKASFENGNRHPGTPKGSKRSPEICAKISEAKKGKRRPPTSKETRTRLSIATKAAWDNGKRERKL